MMAYAIACEGAGMDAMKAAVKAYIQGRVKRDNQTFAPSAAEFAEQVRYQQLVIDAANRPRIEKPKEIEFSEEHRAQKIMQLATLSKALAGDQRAREDLQGMVSIRLDFPEKQELENEQRS